MKIPTHPILALLATSTPLLGFGPISQQQSAPSPLIYQFSQAGETKSYKLCNHEVCETLANGAMVVRSVQGGVNAVMDSVSQNDSNSLVFYPSGSEGQVHAQKILRKKYLVKLRPGADAEEVRQRCGIGTLRVVFPSRGLAVCEEEGPLEVLDKIQEVVGDPDILMVEPLLAYRKTKHLVPNDTFYSPGGGDYQWTFNNTGANDAQPDIDINIEAAWDIVDTTNASGFIDGTGVPIRVIDDGVFNPHDDLENQVDEANDNNFNDGQADDANPNNIFDTHGTQVAGIIGAERDNNLGVSGVAPAADLIGVRLIAGFVDEEQSAIALNYSPESNFVSNNSWGLGGFDSSLQRVPELEKAAIETAVLGDADEGVLANRPLQAGTIFVFSAGNGHENSSEATYNGYANMPETIAVGAISDQGVRSSYSERGANLVVSAPSSGGDGQGVTTTTIDFTEEIDEDGVVTITLLEDGFSNDFGGTSAAAPLVSGVAALMLDAAPTLGWRDVQEILMQTAVKVDPSNGDWYQNAAGFWFNHNYGAGMVDAEAAVLGARDRAAPPLQLPDRGEPLTNLQIPIADIPDGTGDSYVMTFDLSGEPNRRVEHVQLRTRIVTSRRADLDMVLISPNGTQSILTRSHANSDEQSINDYTFMTVRNWGEGSQGTWILRITDVNPDNAAVLNNAQLIINGPEDPTAPIIQAPMLISDRVINGFQNQNITYTIETLGGTSVAVGDLPEGLVFDSATNTISGAPVESGVFSIEVDITGPAGVSSQIISMIVRPTTFVLGAAVEQDARRNFAGGNASWDFEFNETSDGIDAVGSPSDLGDNQEARIGFQDVPGGVAIFDWKVSSEEGQDRLWLALEKEIQPHFWRAFISGEKEWSTVGVRLPNQFNTIEWVYSKGNGGRAGDDRGFLDQVKFVDYETYLKDVEEAANMPEAFEYTTPSRTLWLPVDEATASDGLAIQASGIGNGQNVTLAAWVDGPVNVSFNVKVSTSANGGDIFEYLVDGVVMNSALTPALVGSGVNDWQPVTHSIPSGRRYIELRFRKGLSGIGGDDTVWLDDITVAPVSSALSWAEAHGLGGAGMSEDSDGDGFSNLEEYAFGGNPMLADRPQYLPTAISTDSGNFIEYGVDERNLDLNYVHQESTDLESWVPGTSGTLHRSEGYVSIYRIPAFNTTGEAKKFYRTQVTQNP